jgi:hypothetical protein
MKTRILLSFLFIIFAVAANAQRFKGGVLVGMNASQIDGDTWAGFYKGGLLAGAFVNTELRDKFGAQLEIKYSAKGSAPHKDSPDLRKIRLNYIDVPILGSYEAVENLKLEAGLSLNYLFKAEYYDGAWYDFGEYGPNPFETALIFGLNYSFFKRFDFNIRWNYSLFSVRNSYSGTNFNEGAWFNHVINFGLYFHIGDNNY